MAQKYTFKVITGGDGGVGKTTLLHRFVEGKFLIDTKMTIGVGFYIKKIVFDNEEYSLQLWDFGGEQHFRPFLDSYSDGANGAILMFDLTRMKTLNKLNEWVDIIRKHDPNIPIIFVGAKLDLEDQISVKDEYALEFKEKYKFFEFLKVSSKTGFNVQKTFESLTNEIVKYLKVKYNR